MEVLRGRILDTESIGVQTFLPALILRLGFVVFVADLLALRDKELLSLAIQLNSIVEVGLQYIADFLPTTILEQVLVKVRSVHSLKEESLTIGSKESTIPFDEFILGHLLFDFVPLIQPDVILESVFLVEHSAVLIFGKDAKEIAATVEIVGLDGHRDIPVVTCIIRYIGRLKAVILTIHAVHIVDGNANLLQIRECTGLRREEYTDLYLSRLVGLDRQSQVTFQIIAEALTVELNC